MANLKEIRLRIKSVKTTQQTTKAMKMVSAAKLKKAQSLIVKLRPYAAKLNLIMQNLVSGSDSFSSEFATQRPVKKVLMIVLTSNKGLCGAFNSSMIKLAKATIDSKYKSYLESGNLHIMCVGKKGYEALSKFGLPVHPENIDLFSKVSFEQVSEFADKVMNGFKNGEWDHVDLIFNEFKNAASQIRTINTFLPIQPSVEVSAENVSKEYIFEPNKEEILSSLIPKILKLTMFRAILDSNASEHGQRMVSMDTATENAGQLMSLLKLKFNRERQAAITKEILEIVGAAEALAGK